MFDARSAEAKMVRFSSEPGKIFLRLPQPTSYSRLGSIRSKLTSRRSGTGVYDLGSFHVPDLAPTRGRSAPAGRALALRSRMRR